MAGSSRGSRRLPRQAHDHLFKLVCANPDAALAVVRVALGSRGGILDEVEPGSFQPAPLNEINECLGEDFRDLVLSCRVRGRETLVFFLVEHQRRPVWDMPLRGYDYVRAFWRGRRARAPGAPLPPALAIVVHQGDRPWSGPLSIAEMIDAPGDLLERIGEHVPGLRLALLDLGDRSPADIAALDAPALVRVAFTLMRVVVIPGVAPRQVLDVVRVELAVSLRELMQKPGGVDVLARVVRHTLATVAGLDTDDLRCAFSEAVGPEGGEVVMSTYEELIEKGRRQGLEQGLAFARKVLRIQLEQKFGSMPEELLERVQSASARQLEAWGRRVVPAKKVGDVFDRPASRRSKRPPGGDKKD